MAAEKEVSVLSEKIGTDNLENPELFSFIVTGNEKMRDIFKRVERLATSEKPFLITGETGVGKELIAQAIHRSGERPEPFIPVNVAGLDDTLFSDTLFGHKKGAYTGADSDKEGLIQKAGTGTLFLDEIGDLTKDSQKKLLRLIEKNEFLPLGANIHMKNRAHIIDATNADLDALMKDNKFRKDLFERFTFKLHIPPLRERLEDIPLLAEYFFSKYIEKYEKQIIPPSSELLRLLQQYHYPRNVRELENMIENGVLLCKTDNLDIAVFKEYIEKQSTEEQQYCITDKRFNYSGGFPTIDEMKEHMVNEAMKMTDGKIGAAAHILGISRFSLSRWLKGENE
jgi:transcriptional regulator with PAS, ATPase and Fis domain